MYTFLLKYRGAEACSQYKAKSVEAALRKWTKEELDKLSYESYPGENASMLRPSQVKAMRESLETALIIGVGSYSGIENVWHVGIRVTYQTHASLYIIKTVGKKEKKPER